MEKTVATGDVKQSAFVLRELTETIRINLEILETLRLSNRIRDTDKQYAELLELDRMTRKSVNQFLFTDIPGLIEADLPPGKKILHHSFLDWAAGEQVSLSYLDRLIKEYFRHLAQVDQSLKKNLENLEVRDKRFWQFLDSEQERSLLFEDLVELEEEKDLQQSPDPEEEKNE